MPTLRFCHSFAYDLFRRRHRSPRRSSYARPPAFEELESRRLLSTISWANRGTGPTNDTDGFDALFGGNAAQARWLVDRAILDWEEVIVHFNYNGGGNTFNLTVQTADLTAIADGLVTGQNNGKPSSGRVRIDSIGSMHYLDPTAGDDAEFTTITNAFTGFAPGIVGVDLYATVIHELGHVLGFSRQAGLMIQNSITDTGIDDPNTSNPGNLVAFNSGGGPIEATFTDADTGHLWEGPGTTATNSAGLPWHTDVLMNPGRAIAANERNLISDFEATILRDAYGYTVTMPSTINNMLVNPNFTTDVLTVNGQPGNVNDLIIVQGTPVAGQLHVTVGTVGGGPTYTEIVPWPQIGSINVNAGEGNDIVRLEFNAGRSTTVNGGAGDDITDFAFGTRNLSNITGNTTINGGGGIESVFVYDNNNGASSTYSVTSARFDRPGWGGFLYGSDVENFTLTTGTAADVVNIASTGLNQGVLVANASGADTVNIGNAFTGVQSIRGDVQVQNDPSYTLINIDNSADVTARTITIDQWTGNFGAIAGLAPAYITWDRADVNLVTINTSQGADRVSLLRTSEAMNFFNPGGRDTLTIGNDVDGVQSITGAVEVVPDPGLRFTDIIINNAADTVGRSVTWSWDGFGGFIISGVAPAPIRYDYQSVIWLEVHGGTGDDTFTQTAFSDDWAITNIDGGGGFDTLWIDDRTMPLSLDTAYVSANSFYRLLGVAVGLRTNYSNIDRPVWFAHADTHAIELSGTPSSIPAGQYMSIITGSGNDTISVQPHDQEGNLTINGNVSIGSGGGADLVLVNDASFSLPLNYTIQALGGIGTGGVELFGLGSGLVEIGASAENITVYAGHGSDTFNVNSFKSGSSLAIHAGGGDDTLNFGSTTLAGITNMASFHFDGQDGLDTFNLNNAGTTATWTYYRDIGIVSASSDTGAYYELSESQVELMQLFSGSQPDSFYVQALAEGSAINLYGGGGLDGLALGFFSYTTEDVRGHVSFYGEEGGGHVAVYDSAHFLDKTIHLRAGDLGAVMGDTLFGPGGSLSFSDLANYVDGIGMRLYLGLGIDTVFAQPLPAARVMVDAWEPTTTPGDRFHLALAGVTNPVFTADGIGAGTYSFADAEPVSYTGFELADAFYPGDVNDDGQVNGLDVEPFTAALINGTFSAEADMNQDGAVNGLDVSQFVTAVVTGTATAGTPDLSFGQPLLAASVDENGANDQDLDDAKRSPSRLIFSGAFRGSSIDASAHGPSERGAAKSLINLGWKRPTASRQATDEQLAAVWSENMHWL